MVLSWVYNEQGYYLGLVVFSLFWHGKALDEVAWIFPFPFYFYFYFFFSAFLLFWSNCEHLIASGITTEYLFCYTAVWLEEKHFDISLLFRYANKRHM